MLTQVYKRAKNQLKNLLLTIINKMRTIKCNDMIKDKLNIMNKVKKVIVIIKMETLLRNMLINTKIMILSWEL